MTFLRYTDKPKGFYDSDEEDEEKKENENENDDDDSDKKEESPVIAALERIKNIIEVKFNLPGKEDADQKISVDKNMLVKDFKQKIQPVCDLLMLHLCVPSLMLYFFSRLLVYLWTILRSNVVVHHTFMRYY